MALCFACGEIKHGAFCPCPKCRVESSGDSGLDITFSDHNLDVDSDILRVELHPEMKVKVMEALRGVTLPSVTLRLSPMRRHRAREPDDDA